VKQNISQILKEVLIKVNPSEEEVSSINKFLKELIPAVEAELKKMKIIAKPFVGGSFAKRTMIKKGQYDVDLFIRFDEKYKSEEISKLTERVLGKIKQAKKFSVIHGSRDYFKVNVNPSFFIEIIPVKKAKNPKEAENITDLSYFHVDYIRKKLKTEKMLEEVRLAKAFCHAKKAYGAEGYINGFSGYSLELLIIHYKNFLNFVKQISKIKDKELIDLEKFYKNKNEIMMNMNSAKMMSPIILIDPTYKERNALAALSRETFEKFKIECRKFIKNPRKESFEVKKADFEKLKQNSHKKKEDFVLIKTETDKQEGDIAGSKLLKFYKHLSSEIEKFYKLSNKVFEYDNKSSANFFFAGKGKKELILNGPKVDDEKNVVLFKKRHKETFVKKEKVYAREKFNKTLKQFIEEWKLINLEKMIGMHIANMETN
jgi:tRNA nucleotidyltransferase (CCA-adding enzyme)